MRGFAKKFHHTFAGHDGWAVTGRAEAVLSRGQHVLHLVESALDAAQHLPVGSHGGHLAGASRLLRRGENPVVILCRVSAPHRRLVEAAFDRAGRRQWAVGRHRPEGERIR